MPGFGAILSKQQSDAVRAFVISRAELGYQRQQAAKTAE
jgi:hypothetical protein